MPSKRIAAWKILVVTVAANLLAVSAQAALDPPHTGTVGCLSCHQMTSTYPKLLPPLNHTPLPGDIDDTTSNGLCWSCHYDTMPPACMECHATIPGSTSAPYVLTHSSLATSANYGDWTVECWVCHNQHLQEQKYNGSSYGKYIRQSINLANIKGGDGTTLGKTGIKSVKFLGQTGPNSFADGDPAAINGICEVCHTQTSAWQNDGDYANDGAHKGLKAKNCIPCHPHTEGFKADYKCLDCHADPTNTEANLTRANVKQQFSGNSHHVQRADGSIENTDCYQCHWEADAAGKVTSYHGAAPDAAVDLVIRDSNHDSTPAPRPAVYTLNATAVQYTAGTSAALDLNPHCLGCHNDDLNGIDIFGDGKTPRQYAWDGNSVKARYSRTEIAKLGKYTTTANAAKKDIYKAYSAHGNAASNARGWDSRPATSGGTGVDGAITDSSGPTNVACFDCHNSHGSRVSGRATSYDDQFISPANGGILKDTEPGKGGYFVGYKPEAGGSEADKNIRNAGASLCLDCHLAPTADTTPWGYASTFGATQAIIGYYDSPYLAPGTTGSQQRFPYKNLRTNVGGHFWASSRTDEQNSGMNTTPMHAINGLCTPCHDPHGVSPTHVGTCSNPAYANRPDCLTGGGTWTATPEYGVPMLKGTWMTSPYKEDAAPVNNAVGTVRDNSYPLGYDGIAREGVQYHIDQNTFGANIKAVPATGVTESAAQFAGLCLNCHPKNSLTSGSNGGTWKSVDRIHESVKGWGANVRHNYTCAKCHTTHNGSALPRLMITNCLNNTHKGRTGNNTALVLSGSGSGDDYGCYGESDTLGGCPTYPEDSFNYGTGAGRFPGSFDGFYYSDHFGPNAFTIACHEGQAADQSWNNVTAWTSLAPSITSGPSTGNQVVLLHMDEAAWNGTQNEVKDSSGTNNHGTAYNGATTTTGGISGGAGNFNGSNSHIRINYSPPVDNFTIEAWIKPTTTHEIDIESNSGTGGTFGQRYLFGADHRGSEGGAGISAGTNGISVYEHGDGYMPALAVYSGTISSTEWTHVTVVYLNKRPSIYINGVLARSGLQSLRTHVYAPTWIGGGSYGYFPGIVDEVALYNGALSPADILLHYQRQSSIVCNGTEAEITWTTDQDTTSHVDYGLTASYGLIAGDDALTRNHSVLLTGLSAPATYHFRVRSANDDGEAVSSDYTMTTATCSPVTVTSTSPNTRLRGSVETTVSIAGTGFQDGAAVSFNDANITLGTVTVVNAITITVPVTVTASAIVGAHNVTVTNPDSSFGTGTGVFTVTVPPTVTSTSPGARGQGAGNADIIITGTNFASGATAAFSGTGITVNSTSFTSAASLTANITVAADATPGPRNVTVTNPDSGTGTGTAVFTVNAAPTVTSAAPGSGSQGATNQNVTITGTNFASGAAAVYSGPGITVNSTSFTSATSITANITIAAGATPGPRNVTVTNPDGGTGTGTGIFTVTGVSAANFSISHIMTCYADGGSVTGCDLDFPSAIIWAGPFNSGSSVDRSFIMFDTSSLGTGVTVTSATLYLDFQVNEFLFLDAETQVCQSTWELVDDGSQWDAFGAVLDTDTVVTTQSTGQTSFTINPSYISTSGITKFAVKSALEDLNDDADPGYASITSYLEIQYTTN